jgi:hypothetical protein
MKRIALLLALAQAGALAFAQGAAPAAAPPATRGSAASFICGGIGQPEAEAMKAQARDHDLMLTFVQASGAYLADVDVRITDRQGRTVLSGRCDGPIMLIDLPGSGTWRISAQVNGVTRDKTISTTRGRTARATLVWPAGEPS